MCLGKWKYPPLCSSEYMTVIIFSVLQLKIISNILLFLGLSRNPVLDDAITVHILTHKLPKVLPLLYICELLLSTWLLFVSLFILSPTTETSVLFLKVDSKCWNRNKWHLLWLCTYFSLLVKQISGVSFFVSMHNTSRLLEHAKEIFKNQDWTYSLSFFIFLMFSCL